MKERGKLAGVASTATPASHRLIVAQSQGSPSILPIVHSPKSLRRVLGIRIDLVQALFNLSNCLRNILNDPLDSIVSGRSARRAGIKLGYALDQLVRNRMCHILTPSQLIHQDYICPTPFWEKEPRP